MPAKWRARRSRAGLTIPEVGDEIAEGNPALLRSRRIRSPRRRGGKRKEKERIGILRRRTRNVGHFRYEILLPGAVDEDGITATLDDGVLTVRVPKASTARPRPDREAWEGHDERHSRDH
ncbi:MAG TPA: Hsp20/alpha crystallin family protein [Acidimicrobiia bacterium]